MLHSYFLTGIFPSRNFFWKETRFGIISDLKKCCKDHRKFAYTPHPISSNITVSCDSSSSVKATKSTFFILLYTNLQTSFGSHQFSHGTFCLLPDLIVDTMLYSIVMSPYSLPICDRFLVFPTFQDLFSFEEYRPVGFLWCFPHD